MITVWRFPIVLAMSMLFGMPALKALMLEPDQLFRAGFQYIGALALAWFGVNAVFGLMEHYAQYNHRIVEKEEAERLTVELLEQKRIEHDRDEAALIAERTALATELTGAPLAEGPRGRPVPAGQSMPVGQPMPLGQPTPLGQPMPEVPAAANAELMEVPMEHDPGSPMPAAGPVPQPSTVSIAHDLLREEAGSGIV